MFKSALLLVCAGAAAAMHCKNLTVSISISSRNGVFNLKVPSTEIEITDLFLEFSLPGHNASANYLQGYKTVSGKYKLAATYCEPDHGPGRALQILTHGIGFDRSYWNFSFNNYNYSYVAGAVDAGYSTLSWDRLGVGHSSHGEPVNEIQIFLEIAALRALTKQARAGHLNCVPHKFKKTVHVGHSFGSAMTLGLTAMDPGITDGIVLTGFSQVSQFLPYFALGSNFVAVKEIKTLADGYDVGYLAPKSSIGMHISFFGTGDFDPKILEVATRTGQPATAGELLTLGSGPTSSDFAGPVMVITGDRDVPFCGGNCTNSEAISGSAPNLIEHSRRSFKKAKIFNATVVPNAGHGLNYGYSHTYTYKAITDFLEGNL